MADSRSTNASSFEEETSVARRELHDVVISDQYSLLLRALEGFRTAPPPPYSVIENALSVLMPRMALFELLLMCESPDELTDELSEPPFTEQSLRRIQELVALYGPMLAAAFFRESGPNGNDWANMTRDVLQDVETGEYIISIRLTKRNGDAIRLDTPPNSLLALVSRLLGAASVVPADQFHAPTVAQVSRSVRDLGERIAAAELSAAGE